MQQSFVRNIDADHQSPTRWHSMQPRSVHPHHPTPRFQPARRPQAQPFTLGRSDQDDRRTATFQRHRSIRDMRHGLGCRCRCVGRDVVAQPGGLVVSPTVVPNSARSAPSRRFPLGARCFRYLVNSSSSCFVNLYGESVKLTFANKPDRCTSDDVRDLIRRRCRIRKPRAVESPRSGRDWSS